MIPKYIIMYQPRAVSTVSGCSLGGNELWNGPIVVIRKKRVENELDHKNRSFVIFIRK